MKINIKVTNTSLTPSLNQFIETKIGSLEKFLKDFVQSGIAEAWVEIGKPSKHHYKGLVWRAECDLRLPKKILRAESTNKDLRQAITEIKKELQRQIKTYRESLFAKVNRGARKAKRIYKTEVPDPNDLKGGRTLLE